jgi:hypothetical protein
MRPAVLRRPGPGLLLAVAALLAGVGGFWALAAAAPPRTGVPAVHDFRILYRGFGVVSVESGFIEGGDYDLRPEGCYARASSEAVCGFTLKARRPIVLTNLDNASHAVRQDGAVARSCCLFAGDDPDGFPLVPPGAAAEGVRPLARSLAAGESLAVLLRIPDYARGAPLQAVVFSRGRNDPGIRASVRVRDLAEAGPAG